MKTVCLIGKPNVGKSSIFNRLIHEKKSIILDTPGITRDRIYGIVEYNNKKFNLIDTGGIHGTDEDFNRFQELIETWIGDNEIHRLENWDHVSLSSLVPAIDYLFSRSIRPNVSLWKQATKYPNIINDLPSTHPFYDLFREKPL